MSRGVGRLRGALLGLLAAGCVTAAASNPPPPARTVPAVAEPGPVRVYVANQDAATVTVIDAGRHEVVSTVDLRTLGFGANAKPHHVAVEPDGSYWYLSLIGANRVLKLDRDGRLVAAATFEVPGMLALDPDSDRLYVGRSMSAVNPPRRIGVIDRDDMTVQEIDVLFPRPHAIAAHPDGAVVYTASLARNAMAVVRPDQEAVEVAEIAPPSGEAGVHTLVQWAVSPDGRTLVGTGELSGRLLVYDLSDPSAPRPAAEVDVGARPWHPVFSPDGAEVWLANKGANTVTVVETEGWTVAAVVEGTGLAEPHGAAISPDGQWVYVSSNNLKGDYPGEGGTLTVIDRSRRLILRVIPVGANAAGVGTNARR